jgi:hypothetical protein
MAKRKKEVVEEPLEKKLWKSADVLRLRSTLIIFLSCILRLKLPG